VSRALLDVNVLVALFDPDHVHHDAAHAWLGTNRSAGWATCPLTENALVRILANPAYSGAREQPTQIVRRLQTFCASGHHLFWPDDISLRDARLFASKLPIGHQQLTDIYLLGLAKKNDGSLATFDRTIPLTAVVGAKREHLTVIPA
jgi:toxin-antitoxin system PIN domain toxin